MFNFLKKQSPSRLYMGKYSPDLYNMLRDEVYALEKKKPAFDPYNIKKMRKTIAIDEKIIQVYHDFFDNFGPDEISKAEYKKEEYKNACYSFENAREAFDWDREVLDTMEKILELAEAGVLQSDIKSALPDSQARHVTKICKRFEADKLIKREKRGSTYFITR